MVHAPALCNALHEHLARARKTVVLLSAGGPHTRLSRPPLHGSRCVPRALPPLRVSARKVFCPAPLCTIVMFYYRIGTQRMETSTETISRAPVSSTSREE